MKTFLISLVVINSCVGMQPLLTLLEYCKKSWTVPQNFITASAVNEKDDEGKIALHYALRNNYTTQLIKRLCWADKATVHTPDKDGNQPIHIAAFCGKIDAVELLLRYGANPNAQTNTGRTPLHHAVFTEDYNVALRLITLLKSKEGLLNKPDKCQLTPLHLAASNERFDLMVPLIAMGADQNALSHDHQTPITLVQEILSLAPSKRTPSVDFLFSNEHASTQLKREQCKQT